MCAYGNQLEKRSGSQENGTAGGFIHFIADRQCAGRFENNPRCPGRTRPKEALEAFLAIGERDGFITKNVGNLAGHIEFGEGEELMGVFGHVDVVPTGTGWDTDPFVPVIIDDRIYAVDPAMTRGLRWLPIMH